MSRKTMLVTAVLFAGIMFLGQGAKAAPTAADAGKGFSAAAVLQNGRHCPPSVDIGFGDPSTDPFSSANHNLIPNDACITKGGTVNFTVYGFHQIAVYKVNKDTKRSDVVSNPKRFVDIDNVVDLETPFGTIPDFIINDPQRRVFLETASPVDHFFAPTPDTVSVTLTPGRYMAICVVKPHFLDPDPLANGGMFGFVDVDVD